MRVSSCRGVCAFSGCEVLVRFVAVTGVLPSLWKADIDSAYRRIPLAPAQRWLCGIAFMAAGTVRCAYVLGV